MTNEQLAVLLDGKRRQLERALDEISDKLPHSVFEEKTDGLGAPYYVCPALEPLRDAIRDLKEDADRLMGRL